MGFRWRRGSCWVPLILKEEFHPSSWPFIGGIAGNLAPGMSATRLISVFTTFSTSGDALARQRCSRWPARCSGKPPGSRCPDFSLRPKTLVIAFAPLADPGITVVRSRRFCHTPVAWRITSHCRCLPGHNSQAVCRLYYRWFIGSVHGAHPGWSMTTRRGRGPVDVVFTALCCLVY